MVEVFPLTDLWRGSGNPQPGDGWISILAHIARKGCLSGNLASFYTSQPVDTVRGLVRDTVRDDVTMITFVETWNLYHEVHRNSQ